MTVLIAVVFHDQRDYIMWVNVVVTKLNDIPDSAGDVHVGFLVGEQVSISSAGHCPNEMRYYSGVHDVS